MFRDRFLEPLKNSYFSWMFYLLPWSFIKIITLLKAHQRPLTTLFFSHSKYYHLTAPPSHSTTMMKFLSRLYWLPSFSAASCNIVHKPLCHLNLSPFLVPSIDFLMLLLCMTKSPLTGIHSTPITSKLCIFLAPPSFFLFCPSHSISEVIVLSKFYSKAYEDSTPL